MAKLNLRSKGIALAVVAALSGGSVMSQAEAQSPKPAKQVTLRLGQLNSYDTLTLSKISGTLAPALGKINTAVQWQGPFPSYIPVLEASLSGNVDQGAGSTTPFITTIGRGSDKLLIIGIEDSYQEAAGIIATESSGIKTLADLKGKRVGYLSGGLGEYLLKKALQKANLTVSDTVGVNLAPPDGATAFTNKSIDAWVVWDQYLASALSQPGSRLLANGKDLNSLSLALHFVTKSFAEQHPEIVNASIAALVETSEAAKKDPALKLRVYKEAGAPKQIIDVVAKWPSNTFRPIKDAEVKDLQAHAEELARFGLIKSAPDVAQYVYRAR